MKNRKLWWYVLLLLTLMAGPARAHQVSFCGEVVPMTNEFVANKLMNVIRNQIPNVNLPSLRQRALTYFPYVEGYLRRSGLPEDFKYLPIVESGFMVLTSRVGARGFWQIMPATARDLGLAVSPGLDERDDITKSTTAACKLLASYYKTILQRQKLASWVLTAAAYNFGIGNILKAIQTKGGDYFTMSLNPETAVYVYKIIAVKELFEYPELYMKNFGYNVFTTRKDIKKGSGDAEAAFASISVKVGNKGKAPPRPKTVFVAAHIKGKYKDFKDGDLVSLEIDEDLLVKGGYTRKGTLIKGAGWVIDDRVYVDLGYGHDVLLFDADAKKGVKLDELRKGQPVLLKNDIYDDGSQW